MAASLAVEARSDPPPFAVAARSVQSSFVDGMPSGTRTLPDGSTIDLTSATNMLNCGKATTCSIAEMNTWTAERPFGANNPRWTLFAYAPLHEMIETGTINSTMYVVVWAGDDIAENDADPLTDGIVDGNRGRGVLMLRAMAFGPAGTQASLEVTIARTDTTDEQTVGRRCVVIDDAVVAGCIPYPETGAEAGQCSQQDSMPTDPP